MGTAVDGLVTGLDTTSIINQLMAVEAGPQTRLKTTLTSQQADVIAFQAVNTKMAALQAAATKLSQATTWTQGSATSSDSAVSVTAGTGALTGSVTFSVKALASAQSSISTQTYTSLSDTSSVTDPVFEIHAADGSLRAAIDPGDGSLAALVSAINTSDTAGVRASAVQVSAGVYRLQLTAKSTGTANDFTVTGADGAPLTGLAFTDVTAAADARIHVGDPALGYDITSSSNTIEGLMPGLTIKATALADDVTVDMSQDTGSITNAVQALVDAANAALSSIAAQSKQPTVGADGTSTGGGALAGDSGLRELTNKILSTVTSAIGGKSASTVGISTTRDGQLTFDPAKFAAAMAADPDAAQAMFDSTTGTQGLSTRLAAIGKAATDSGTGSIALAIQGRNSLISDLTDRITDWDTRLAARKTALQRQYASLEVALGKLQSQSTWLAGQLNSLATQSSQ